MAGFHPRQGPAASVAASYELDFGGDLFREAQASIATGLSAVEVSLPGSAATVVVAETTLGSVDVGEVSRKGRVST